MIAQDESALQPLGRVGSNHYSYTAKTVREAQWCKGCGLMLRPWHLLHPTACLMFK